MIPLLAALVLAGPADPGVDDIVQKGFKDASFVAVVRKAVHAELRKISDDFGNSYRFTSTKAFLKEPLMLRLEGTVDDTDILYIVSGYARLTRVPRARVNVKEDLKNSPGKIQTPLDFGLVTPAIMDQLYVAKFVRTDRATGNYVFDLTYKSPRFDNTARQRVWVDPEKRYTAKRESYAQNGRHTATYFYDNAKLLSGVWMPTRLTVRNVEDKLAGITEYTSVKVNTGLTDAFFKID